MMAERDKYTSPEACAECVKPIPEGEITYSSSSTCTIEKI